MARSFLEHRSHIPATDRTVDRMVAGMWSDRKEGQEKFSTDDLLCSYKSHSPRRFFMVSLIATALVRLRLLPLNSSG